MYIFISLLLIYCRLVMKKSKDKTIADVCHILNGEILNASITAILFTIKKSRFKLRNAALNTYNKCIFYRPIVFCMRFMIPLVVPSVRDWEKFLYGMKNGLKLTIIHSRFLNFLGILDGRKLYFSLLYTPSPRFCIFMVQ